MADPTPAVVNNAGGSRFELTAEGHTAVLDYVLAGSRLRLMHTEVPPELRGRKYAEVLARAGLEYARSNDLKVVPFCPFVRAFLQRHPEYESVLDERWKAMIEGGPA
jgi:predicted GNAT family acetyltransferase